MSFPNNIPPSGAKTGLKTVSLGEYFNQPTNGNFPSFIDIANEFYLDNEANKAVRDYSWDGKQVSDAVTRFNFQPLTSVGFANLTSTSNIQHIFPSTCLFYARTVFEHSLQYNKMTRMTLPDIVSMFSKALSDANLSDKDGMNLWEIAIKYATALTTGNFIVIPDTAISANLLSDPLRSDKLTNFWVQVEQQLSGRITPYAIGKDQEQLKFEISTNLYQIFLGNALGFNGSDAAYNAVKNNDFTTWRGLSNIKQQWYFQKPRKLDTFTANVSATFNGTASDININKVMDYSFIKNVVGFLQADGSMIHAETPRIEINDYAIADKTTIVKGWMWMNDHAVLPTHQPWFWMVLDKAPTYEDYKNAYNLITSLQPSIMGLYVNNPGQKVAEDTTPGNQSNTYDIIGWNDFVTLRTLAWDNSSNTYKLGQGSLNSNLKNGTQYDWIKKAQADPYDYLFGENGLFFVNNPNVALSKGQNAMLYTAQELSDTNPLSMNKIDVGNQG